MLTVTARNALASRFPLAVSGGAVAPGGQGPGHVVAPAGTLL
ncbi:hypothetical protein ACIOGX_11165 [Streptomyces sp. NPDC088147]